MKYYYLMAKYKMRGVVIISIILIEVRFLQDGDQTESGSSGGQNDPDFIVPITTPKIIPQPKHNTKVVFIGFNKFKAET